MPIFAATALICLRKNLRISSDITSIGDGAFADCTNLTSINLPQRIKTIGKGAFSR
ncbi:MAG: leucine-rich repeat protein, partial [Bacillota bacterium]